MKRILLCGLAAVMAALVTLGGCVTKVMNEEHHASYQVQVVQEAGKWYHDADGDGDPMNDGPLTEVQFLALKAKVEGSGGTVRVVEI